MGIVLLAGTVVLPSVAAAAAAVAVAHWTVRWQDSQQEQNQMVYRDIWKISTS